MSVTPRPLDPQAAVELAYELVLVTRATFAQLLPETATRAVSGVPGLGGATVTATPYSAPAMAQVSPVPAQSVAAPPPAPTPTVPSPPAVRTPAASSVSVHAITVPVAAALAEPATTSEEDALGGDHPVTPDVGTPTISLGAARPAVADENPADYVPVPGVETPTAPSVPLMQPVPIAVPVSLVTSMPGEQATPEPGTAEAGAVEPSAPSRPFHPNLAMLEEIGFLDE